MKTITLKEIEELQGFIAQKKARAISISKRIGDIAASIGTMNVEELEAARLEKDELIQELNDIIAFVNKNQKIIRDFYKPAIR